MFRRSVLLVIMALSVLSAMASADTFVFPVNHPGSDTYAVESQPYMTHGSLSSMYIGVDTAFIKYAMFVQFPELDNYEADDVSSAILSLYFTVPKKREGTLLKIVKCTEEWSENTLTWDNQPAGDAVEYTYGFPYSDVPFWIHYDITGMVYEWMSGTADNYGIKLFTDVHAIHYAYASTSEYSQPEKRPYLTVDMSIGIESSSLGGIKAAFK